MIRLAIIFAILAVVAAIFNAGGLAGEFANIAWILVVVFVVLAVISAIFGRRATGGI